MIHQTKGIVLRTIKYGESSVITSIFTEMFGTQSYIVNGIRTSQKSSNRAALLQPSSILEMEVYNNELRNLHRIKEFRWAFLYQHVLSDVTKNAVAVFMAEILHKCLKQPESNPQLYQFAEESFIFLDSASQAVTANFPLYFALHLVHFFGFSLLPNYSSKNSVLDLREGAFQESVPEHSLTLQGDNSYHLFRILQAVPTDLQNIKLSKASRLQILLALQSFYAYHINEFGTLKTLPILQEILS